MPELLEPTRASLAPVVPFAFNRPEHTAKTLSALERALKSRETDLYVYIDGPRNSTDIKAIAETRATIEEFSGFNRIFIAQRSSNLGLARNIVEGVTEVINARGKIIVLEDDIVVSKGFLVYMNEALLEYECDERIWHVSGYNEGIGADDEAKTFLWRVMRCWGWGTWKNRWAQYEKDPEKIVSQFSSRDIRRFNLDGFEKFFDQVLANCEGKIDTWAVFWYATIFQNNGLCLNPAVSLVQNIGFDGTGVHSRIDNGKHSVSRLNSSSSFRFPRSIEEDKEVVRALRIHFRKHNSLLIRFRRKIREKRNILGRNL